MKVELVNYYLFLQVSMTVLWQCMDNEDKDDVLAMSGQEQYNNTSMTMTPQGR